MTPLLLLPQRSIPLHQVLQHAPCTKAVTDCWKVSATLCTLKTEQMTGYMPTFTSTCSIQAQGSRAVKSTGMQRDALHAVDCTWCNAKREVRMPAPPACHIKEASAAELHPSLDYRTYLQPLRVVGMRTCTGQKPLGASSV